MASIESSVARPQLAQPWSEVWEFGNRLAAAMDSYHELISRRTKTPDDKIFRVQLERALDEVKACEAEYFDAVERLCFTAEFNFIDGRMAESVSQQIYSGA